MSRFMICLTLFLAIVTLAYAQVEMINTPTGDITQGVKILVTWKLVGPTTQAGVLRAVNKDTQASTTLSETLDLNALQYEWVVNVDPGSYNFALNDGTGDKFSGLFNVVAPKTPAAPGKAPADGKAPAPADGKAPVPADGKAPDDGKTPAAKEPKTPTNNNKSPAAGPSQPPKAPAEKEDPKDPKTSNQEANPPPNSSGNSVPLVFNLLLSLISVTTFMIYSA